MRDLLLAHAHRTRAPVGEIRVNTEDKAKDDGSDGWSPSPSEPDEWLKSGATCWQFKAGVASQPSRLTNEVTKKIPKETLLAGGRFVLVASGSTNGKMGEEERLAKLRADAAGAGLPVAAIEVIGSDRLANWCNSHPAVAARWASRPQGLNRLEDWMRSDEHQVPWQSNPEIEKEMERRRGELDTSGGSVLHLHIQGPPGVGKSRFALELCRSASWGQDTIYIRQSADVRLMELIDSAAVDQGVRLVVVADEVQAEQLPPLRDSVARGNGRIRLISIGHCSSPDPSRIPVLKITPLADQQMAEVIKGWHSSMPPEHIAFVVRFAGGYVRLARLASNAIAANPAANVRNLLDLSEIRTFLDRMLGPDDRRHLYVVAALTSVGWTDDAEIEGQAVAKHFGLDWNETRARIEQIHSRHGIAPRGGRYRYISPTPLGVYLAVEAWTALPDLLKTLPGVLPTDEAKEAYYERLRSIASNPQAQRFAKEELSFFFQLDQLKDTQSAKRWASLASADPALAARGIRRALSGATVEARLALPPDVRSELRWALIRLAWMSTAFHDATYSLALMAEAENETWSNNSTGEFLGRFQIFLGGTAVPYVERMTVLDDLLDLNRPIPTKLVVEALARVGNQHATRIGNDPASDQVPEVEWRPRTQGELLACYEAAFSRLTQIANDNLLAQPSSLQNAGAEVAMLLRNEVLRDRVAVFLVSVRERYPELREQLRRKIADVIDRETKYWKELGESDLKYILDLHASFEDSSLDGRLRQVVGPGSWDDDRKADLTEFLQPLLDRQVLAAEWGWLTSGDAADGWRLGEALATYDLAGVIEEVASSLPNRGPDLRFLCGYVRKRRELNGDAWYENWLVGQTEKNPDDLPLLFEMCWRCGVTPKLAELIATTIRRTTVNANILGRLEYGLWAQELSKDAVRDVVSALRDRGQSGIAVSILAHRIKEKPDELEWWQDIAIELLVYKETIRSRQMTAYYWKQLATIYASRNVREISAAIFREQADRKSHSWFLEYSDAKEILKKCIKENADAVWNELIPYINDPKAAASFSIGFPLGLLEKFPAASIERWLEENPEERGPILARLVKKDLTSDSTLASRLIGKLGNLERVSNTFFSAYVSGAWSGAASDHWTGLANGLRQTAKHTSLPKLKRWATNSAETLGKMAEREKQREEEEELRGFR